MDGEIITRIHGRGYCLLRSLSRDCLQCSGLVHTDHQLRLLARRYGRSWSHPLLSDGSTSSSFACCLRRPPRPIVRPRCAPSDPSSWSSGTALSQLRRRNWQGNATDHYCAGSLSRQTRWKCFLGDWWMNRGYNSLRLRGSRAVLFRYWHAHRTL